MRKKVELIQKNFSELTAKEQTFLTKAEEATGLSYAPYSEFHVGSAVELKDETIVLGANQENSSFPSGLCAERVALFQCAKDLSNPVVRIAVMAKSDKFVVPDPLVPCAGCLQVIADIRNRQKHAIEIWMWDGNDSVHMATDVDQFLPFHFELSLKA